MTATAGYTLKANLAPARGFEELFLRECLDNVLLGFLHAADLDREQAVFVLVLFQELVFAVQLADHHSQLIRRQVLIGLNRNALFVFPAELNVGVLRNQGLFEPHIEVLKALVLLPEHMGDDAGLLLGSLFVFLPDRVELQNVLCRGEYIQDVRKNRLNRIRDVRRNELGLTLFLVAIRLAKVSVVQVGADFFHI